MRRSHQFSRLSNIYFLHDRSRVPLLFFLRCSCRLSCLSFRSLLLQFTASIPIHLPNSAALDRLFLLNQHSPCPFSSHPRNPGQHIHYTTTTEAESAEAETTGAETIEAKTAEVETTGAEMTEAETAEAETAEAETTEAEMAEAETTED